jgi:predicted Fe-Mo cluster-binding NifX family protein
MAALHSGTIPHSNSSFNIAGALPADEQKAAPVSRPPLLQKSEINILLLENVHKRAVEMLQDEGYNVCKIPSLIASTRI